MFRASVWMAGAAFAVLALAVSGTSAQAADIPCRTAKLIVPWGAGGGTDVIFRTFVESVNKQGAKPQLQVVNISGQGGNKGKSAHLPVSSRFTGSAGGGSPGSGEPRRLLYR